MALSAKIDKILKSRQTIKDKLKQNKMVEEMSEEQISKFTTPLAQQINEPLIKKLEEIKPLAPIMLPPMEAAEPRRILGPPRKKRKPIELDIDKNVDSELIRAYKYPMPSEILMEEDESQRNAIIEGVITTTNKLLQQLGGKVNKLKERERESINTVIKKFRNYKIALNSIQKIPHFELQEPSTSFSFASPSTPRFGKGILCNDDPCKRLELLIASRQAGNDAPEILSEAKSIIEKLYQDGSIQRNDLDMITRHFLK